MLSGDGYYLVVLLRHWSALSHTEGERSLALRSLPASGRDSLGQVGLDPWILCTAALWEIGLEMFSTGSCFALYLYLVKGRGHCIHMPFGKEAPALAGPSSISNTLIGHEF